MDFYASSSYMDLGHSEEEVVSAITTVVDLSVHDMTTSQVRLIGLTAFNKAISVILKANGKLFIEDVLGPSTHLTGEGNITIVNDSQFEILKVSMGVIRKPERKIYVKIEYKGEVDFFFGNGKIFS